MGTTPASGAVERAIGLFVPKRSELRRSSDRIEVVARWAVLLVGLLFLPAALTVGSELAASQQVTAAAQRAERHPVTAEVLAEPDSAAVARPDITPDGLRAPVRWIAADGTTRVALVRVPSTARPGDSRVLWVDRDDRPTAAPPSPGDPAEQGFLTAMLLVIGDLLVSLFLLAALRWVLDRARLRAWDAAWRRFTGPDQESKR
jgi:hypothetical protein